MNDAYNIKDKMYGCLYGHAIGDALGLISEFLSKPEIELRYPEGISAYLNNKGIWEDDDTNQMLCILDELIENRGIIPKDLAGRLNYWLITDGRGCGSLVYQVINHHEFLENPYKAAYDRWILSGKEAAPNGGIMRTSVIGLIPTGVEKNAEAACKVTHYDSRCVGSCVIVSMIIYNLVWNNYQLSYEEIKSIAEKYDERIVEWIEMAYQSEDIAHLDLDESHSIGYTLRTLSAALWCYWHARTFEEGLLTIVNEGGDADTNAAVACAILGAKYGYNSIPEYYITNLYNEDIYRTKVNKFISIAVKENNR